MIEGSFVKWFDKVDRYGIVDDFNEYYVKGFVIERADPFTLYYYQKGGKDNVKIESEVLPVEIEKFGGKYGVYSKTCGEGGTFSHPNDNTISVIGSKPVEPEILHLLRDHAEGRSELEKTYTDDLIEEIVNTTKADNNPYDAANIIGIAMVFRSGLTCYVFNDSDEENDKSGSDIVVDCAQKLNGSLNDFITSTGKASIHPDSQVAAILVLGDGDERGCINSVKRDEYKLNSDIISSVINGSYDEYLLTPETVNTYIECKTVAPGSCYCDAWCQYNGINYS